MSNWDEWAETLTDGGKNESAAIIARDGSSVWGKSYGFTVIFEFC